MGVYAMSRSTLAHCPRDIPFGFDDLVHDLLARQDPPRAYHFDGYWLDIGRPDDYDEANRSFEELRPRPSPAGPAGPSHRGRVVMAGRRVCCSAHPDFSAEQVGAALDRDPRAGMVTRVGRQRPDRPGDRLDQP